MPRGAAAPASISAARRSAPAPCASRRNWGFEPEPLAYAVRTADGAAPREINPLEPEIPAASRGLAEAAAGLANRLGPLIARGLG